MGSRRGHLRPILALGRPPAGLGGASCGRLSGIENYFWCTLFWSRRGIRYWGSGIVRGAGIRCSSRGDVFARKFFVVASDLKFRPTGLSCRTFAANAVRLQLDALAYNLGNFLRTLATREPVKDWSLTSLKEKLIKIGAKVVSHGRYVAFQAAEVAIPRQMFQEVLRLIAELRPQPPSSACVTRRSSHIQEHPTGGVRSNASENNQINPRLSFLLPKLTVAGQISLLSCRTARKYEYSRQIGAIWRPGFLLRLHF